MKIKLVNVFISSSLQSYIFFFLEIAQAEEIILEEYDAITDFYYFDIGEGLETFNDAVDSCENVGKELVVLIEFEKFEAFNEFISTEETTSQIWLGGFCNEDGYLQKNIFFFHMIHCFIFSREWEWINGELMHPTENAFEEEYTPPCQQNSRLCASVGSHKKNYFKSKPANESC